MDENVDLEVRLHLTLLKEDGTIEVSSNSNDPFELLYMLSNAVRIVMEQYDIDDDDFDEEHTLH